MRHRRRALRRLREEKWRKREFFGLRLRTYIFAGDGVKINKSWPKIVWTGAIRCSDDDDDDDVYAT